MALTYHRLGKLHSGAMTMAAGPALTLLLGALVAIAPLAMDIYLASMPSMTRSLAASAEMVQLTLVAYMFGWGISQLFVGSISDRYGRRPVLLAGLGLFVAASLACAAAQDVRTLIVARLFQALGMSAAAVVPRAVVRDLYSAERAARMLSLMGMVLGIAPVVAPVLGSHLHVWFGWQANFLFVAAYGVFAIVFAARGLPETLRERNARALDPRIMVSTFGRLLASRRFVGYALVAAFSTAGLFAFLTGSSFVFISVMRSGETGFGLMFALVMLGNITGAALASRWVMRLGIDGMIRRASWLMLAAGLSMAALAWARVDHPFAVVTPMFLYMVAFTSTMPQATAGALTPFPKVAGAASSLLSFCQFVLASASALAVGLAFDGTQRPMATAIAIAALLTFAAFRLVVPQQR